MSITRFILVRHGQTAWNRDIRFRGREDLYLDETGKQQAWAVAQAVAQRYTPAALYCSPLIRTYQTAEAIAQATGVSPTPHEGIIDIDYGDWQGLSPAEVSTRYGSLYDDWLQRPHTVLIPQGETLAQVRARVWPVLLELIGRHVDQTIVLVGHQTVNKVLLCAVLGLDDSAFWTIEQATACLNVFAWTGTRFVVELLNDTCHLTHPLSQR